MTLRHNKLYHTACSLPAVLHFKELRVLSTPLYHRIDDRYQGLSERRNGIFRTGRKLRVNGFRHKAVFNQFFQLQVEHTGRGFGENAVQLARPQRLTTQLTQYTRLPLRVYQAHCQAQGAVQINRNLSLVHIIYMCVFVFCKGNNYYPKTVYTE